MRQLGMIVKALLEKEDRISAEALARIRREYPEREPTPAKGTIQAERLRAKSRTGAYSKVRI